MTREECCAVVAEKDMPRTVYDMIVAMQEKYAERPAFRWVDDATKTVQEKTYGQFVEDIRKMTSYLQANVADVKGQRIVILSRTNYEYGVVTFGAVMAGAVIVTLNQKKTWPELEYELGLSEPALIFTDGIDYGYADELKAAYGDKLRPMNAYEGSTPAELANRIDTNALMMLMFTSGTTGLSKGVMMSERNLFSAGHVLWAISAQLADKIDLTKPLPGHYMVLPMFHLGAFIDLFSTTVMGWPLNLGSDIRDFYRDIQKMPSQIMSVVPMIMNSLHKDVMRGHRDRLGDLWVPIDSSAMFDPQVLLDMVHNGMFVIQCYGATETCAAGIINFAQDEKHIGAVGQGSEYMDYKIEPDGELCMRGDCVMMGYYKDPEGTAEVIDKDGWVHTGDLARVDEDGYYYIIGRKKNLIILDSGENISPEELEDLVEKCPAVQECVVKEMGKKIGAVVYCPQDKQQTVQDHITEMNRTLPLYKRIGVVEFSAEPLPRNATGKLLR